jgi:serine/threonine protein kinase
VRIYDLGVADDHAYIAMEHFPAGDLRQRMKAPLTPTAALDYLRQIASALDAIHSVGVLHRDLKPANIMLRATARVCLIDFGLAKANDARRRIDGHARDLRHALLHEPGAGPCGADRCAQRPVQPRRHLLRDADGPKALQGRSAMEVIYKHRARICRSSPRKFAPTPTSLIGCSRNRRRPLPVGARTALRDRHVLKHPA